MKSSEQLNEVTSEINQILTQCNHVHELLADLGKKAPESFIRDNATWFRGSLATIEASLRFMRDSAQETEKDVKDNWEDDYPWRVEARARNIPH